MTTPAKLDEPAACQHGLELTGAIEEMCARRGWTNGDMLAVVTVAFTELIARRIGKFPSVEFFRDHADHMEQEIMAGGK